MGVAGSGRVAVVAQRTTADARVDAASSRIVESPARIPTFGGWPAVALALAALACRGALVVAIERAYGLPAHSYWLIPLRDLLSGAVFVAGLVARDVRWRQQRYRLKSEGTLMPERRSPSP